MNAELLQFTREDQDHVLALQKKVHARVYKNDRNGFPFSTIEDKKKKNIQPHSPKGLRVLKKRMQLSGAYRETVMKEFKQEFPGKKYHQIVMGIADQIADPINEIFLIQMQHVKRPIPRSWEDDAPDQVKKLKHEVDALFIQHKDFFDAFPEYQSVLYLLAYVVPYVRKSEELKAYGKLLEEYAIHMIKKGMPALIILFSDYYTLPNDDSLELYLTEADVRVLFPILGEDKQRLDELVCSQQKILRRVFGFAPEKYRNKKEDVFTILYGAAVQGLSSGSQMQSVTSGEALAHFLAFYFSPGHIKTFDIVKKSLKLAGICATQREMMDCYLAIYAGHEASHPLAKNILFRIVEEFCADIPMCVANMVLFARNKEERPRLMQQMKWEHYIAVLLGECIPLLKCKPTGNDMDDGYTISGKTMIALLIRHGIITLSKTDFSYSICPLTKENMPKIHAFVHDAIQLLHIAFSGDEKKVVTLRNIDDIFCDVSKDISRLTYIFT